MDFCARCSAVLMKRDGDMLICGCGHRQMPQRQLIKEKGELQKPVEIVDRQINPMATFDHVCRRCGFAKAELLTKGTIITDEDEFFMHKCGKCGFTENADGLKVT